MDVTSAGNTPKRGRSKAKADGAAESTSTKASARSRKTKAVELPVTAPVTVTAVTAIQTPSEDELLGMIATAAYFRAEQRNFEPGHEIEDWLEAERQIRTLHT